MSAVENVLSTTFWAVPALSRVEPAITSGPTGTSTAWSTRAASSVPVAQTTAAVSCAGRVRRLDPADRPRRAAARRHGDHHVVRRGRERADGGGARCGVVLGGGLGDRAGGVFRPGHEGEHAVVGP